MRKIFRVMSFALLFLLTCSSATFAADHVKTIAILPIQTVDCRENAITEDVKDNLNSLVRTQVDKGIDTFSRHLEADGQEGVAVFQRLYAEKKAVNKKATYRDVVALTARELKADLIVVPMAVNCTTNKTEANGHNMLVASSNIIIYVYDKMSGNINTYKSSEHYNGVTSGSENFDTLIERCMLQALKKANLAGTVEMTITSW